MSVYEPDPREEKLPKWAQQELHRMRADLTYAGRRLSEGADETTRIWADPYSANPRPIGGIDSSLRFQMPLGDMTIRLRDDGDLSVLAQSNRGRLVVKPEVSNGLCIGFVR